MFGHHLKNVFHHLHVETNILLTKENILIAVFYEL